MDISNPRILKLKGILFLLLGLLSGGLLLAQVPDFQMALLLGIAIWSFCRFYYFAFYVLERYADPNFRYAGLADLIRYLVTGKQGEKRGEAELLDYDTNKNGAPKVR